MSQYAHACGTRCMHELGVPGGCTRVGILGGYTGWVYWVLYRVPSQLPGEQSHTSEAGPGSPQGGLEWVGMGLRAH